MGHFTFFKALIFIHLLKNIWVPPLCQALLWAVANQTRSPEVYSLIEGGDKKTNKGTRSLQIVMCYEGGKKKQLVKISDDFRCTGQGNLSGSDI